MAPKIHSPSFIIIISLFIAGSTVSASSGDRKPLRIGGARPISDPSDPKVVEAAVFAVAEHNRLANGNLSFQSVINGTEQAVGGRLYRLEISAVDAGGGPGNIYLARVYDKPWQHLKILISFENL